MSERAPDASLSDFVPDFCRGSALLRVAVIMLLVAMVLTLAVGAGKGTLERFLLLSVYLEWIGLCSAAALCAARRWLNRTPLRVLFPACWGLLTLVTVTISFAGYEVLLRIGPEAGPLEARGAFLFRSAVISGIVALFVLSWFWMQHQSRQQVLAEADARFEALQARIRPHFLFNSLNSIAALVAVRPDEAERLIEDLSELMRVSLDVRRRLVPLRRELEIAEAYLRIEQARLGDRLVLDWRVPESMRDFPVPLLSVQPLVENAVYHGIGKLDGTGTLRIEARRTETAMIVEVANPVPAASAERHQGHRLALDNIAQRLALIYGGQAHLSAAEEGSNFVARLQLPPVADPLSGTTP